MDETPAHGGNGDALLLTTRALIGAIAEPVAKIPNGKRFQEPTFSKPARMKLDYV